MKDVVSGLASQCAVFLRDNDVSNPGMYGSCNINHGTSVTWDMADGTQRSYEYVDDFNLGSSGSDEDENIIARY